MSKDYYIKQKADFTMNRKDIIGEATEYDKKLALEEKKPKSWCKSVSAFANTFGGALIFGISNEGMAVGLEDPEGDAEKISEVIKTRLEPIPEFKLRFHKTEDGRVWSSLMYIRVTKPHIIIREMAYWKLMFALEMKV